jgi:hypothetical protein
MNPEAAGLYVWVHTCPQRVDHIGQLLDSLAESDVDRFDVRCHEPGLSWSQIGKWWVEQWEEAGKKATGRGAALVLRLEDDVVVNRHLEHNVSSWPAVRLPDFGVGSLFLEDSLIARLAPFEVDTQTGAMRTHLDRLAFGQAQVVPAEQCGLFARTAFAATEALRRAGTASESEFDCGLTRAAHDYGKRTYLHVPSLVQTTALSGESILDRNASRAHSASRTWKSDWRRDDRSARDVEAEHLWGYETRWAVLNDGGKGFVVPVRCTPNPTEPEVVSCQGRSLIMTPERLLPTPEAAEEARRCLFS